LCLIILSEFKHTAVSSFVAVGKTTIVVVAAAVVVVAVVGVPIQMNWQLILVHMQKIKFISCI